ncbi:MAG: AzlC family ABC transporter permease [Erysipelotrichaceae bacterium]|nr:AzlC family ABC transporter permease [Erysipelotrichaceae bacterium]
MFIQKETVLKKGFKDGIPIGLGYFAVAFSLGIMAARASLSAFQGFVASLLCNASAGEYAAFSLIAQNAPYLEVMIMTVVANARYLLMSAALSQRCADDLRMRHRLLLSFYITDELFAITIAQKETKIDPFYTYGAVIPATLMWASGTALGIVAGNVLPLRIVSALSVALYGMFIAIIIPPAKEDRVIMLLVIASFLLSFLAANFLPYLKDLSGGTRTIILTVVISLAAALLFPKEFKDE